MQRKREEEPLRKKSRKDRLGGKRLSKQKRRQLRLRRRRLASESAEVPKQRELSDRGRHAVRPRPAEDGVQAAKPTKVAKADVTSVGNPATTSGEFSFLADSYQEPAPPKPRTKPPAAPVKMEAKREAKRRTQELIVISAVGGLAILVLIVAIVLVVLSRQPASRAPGKNGATNKRAEIATEKEKAKDSEKEKPSPGKDLLVSGQLEGVWLDAFRVSASMGDIAVKVSSVELGSPKMVNGESFGESLLMVRLELSNGGRQNVAYASWNMASDWTSVAWLTDVAGNKYQMRRFRPAMVGQLSRVMNIAPGTSVEDLLIFPRPALGNGASLKLQLPAAVVQAKGSANFQIPSKMVMSTATTGEAEGGRPSLVSAGFKQKDLPAASSGKKFSDDDKETISETGTTKAGKNTDETEKDQDQENPAAGMNEKKSTAKASKSRNGGESSPTSDPKKDFGIDPDEKAPF